jgi:hypothetical protein|tara:strand:+ start:3302 stop:3802 length:501 start_codon:yes stop_codon:yes gene_type:complete
MYWKKSNLNENYISEQVVDQGVDPQDVVRLLRGKAGLGSRGDSGIFSIFTDRIPTQNADGSVTYTFPGFEGYTITIRPNGTVIIAYRGVEIASYDTYDFIEAGYDINRFIGVIRRHNAARVKLFKNLTAQNIFDIKRDRAIMNNPGVDPYRSVSDIMRDRAAGNTP